jgi:hypothetical protein
MVRSLFALLVFPLDPAANPDPTSWEDHNYIFFNDRSPPLSWTERSMSIVLLSVFTPSLIWLAPDLIQAMEQREGIFANQDMLEDERFACTKLFVNRFLASPDSRRSVVAMLEKSKMLRLWMLRTGPDLLFRLVRQPERTLIYFFLQPDDNYDENTTTTIRGMRNAHGRDLLLHACTCRGRIERIIEMLVRQHGYSLEATDSNGDDALALATKDTDAKTQSMVAYLVSEHSQREQA